MKNVIFAILEDNSTCLINENQICTVRPGKKISNVLKQAVIGLSNGEQLNVVSPDWDQWENDLFQAD